MVLGGYLTPLGGGNLALVVREGVIMGRLLTINTVIVAQNLTIGSHGLRLDS